MAWFFLLLAAFLGSCSQNHDQNNPYVIENTNPNYNPPEPYAESQD